MRNSNLDLVTSAELNQAARLDGDATHCGTTCEKLDRIIFSTASTSVFFGTQETKKIKMSTLVLILTFLAFEA